MELQEIPKERPKSSEEGAGELMLEVSSGEAAELDHYEKIMRPTEDVYSETFHSPVKSRKGKQDEGKLGLYRLLCLVLTVICLILLIVVFVLSVKLGSGSTVCPADDFEDQQSLSPTCSLEKCRNLFPETQFKHAACQQCASGWLTFGTSCFFLSTTRLTWTESQKNCSSLGGSLAIVTDPSVQSFLTREGKLKYWIGLRSSQSRWTWVNNNELQRSYWEEATQNGDCAFLQSDGPVGKNWASASCQASTYFICQLQF